MAEKKQKRGFAVMSPDKVQKCASLGGKIAHMSGKAYRFTTESAKAAGRKSWETRRARMEAEKAAEKDSAIEAEKTVGLDEVP